MLNHDILRVIIRNMDFRDLYVLVLTNSFICKNIQFVMNANNSVLKHKIKIVMINKSFNNKMIKASDHNYRDLVKFFIEKGAYDFNRGMEGAARNGHIDLINFLLKKAQIFGVGE